MDDSRSGLGFSAVRVESRGGGGTGEVGGGPKSRPKSPGVLRGMGLVSIRSSSSRTGRSLFNRDADGREDDTRAPDGSSSSGSIVRGMVSPIGGEGTADLDRVGTDEGRPAFGRTSRGEASSTLSNVVGPASGNPAGEESDRELGKPRGIGNSAGGLAGAGVRAPFIGRDAGAVTPGIASMGRFSGRGREVGGTTGRGGGGGVSRLVAAPLAGGSSEGGSSGGASCAGDSAASISHKESVLANITTSLIIAGTRLDSSLDAWGSITLSWYRTADVIDSPESPGRPDERIRFFFIFGYNRRCWSVCLCAT